MDHRAGRRLQDPNRCDFFRALTVLGLCTDPLKRVPSFFAS